MIKQEHDYSHLHVNCENNYEGYCVKCNYEPVKNINFRCNKGGINESNNTRNITRS